MRYVKTPVEFDWRPSWHPQAGFTARLKCGCDGYDDFERKEGHGSTEDEAYADLLSKLGYEGVDDVPTDLFVPSGNVKVVLKDEGN